MGIYVTDLDISYIKIRDKIHILHEHILIHFGWIIQFNCATILTIKLKSGENIVEPGKYVKLFRDT